MRAISLLLVGYFVVDKVAIEDLGYLEDRFTEKKGELNMWSLADSRPREKRPVSRFCSLLLLLGLLASLNLPGAAQPMSQDAFEPQMQPPNFVRRGADVPRYIVVRQFFEFAFRCYQGPNWSGLLEQIDIRPGSGAAVVLKEAMIRANAITSEGIDLRPYIAQPERYKRVQLEFTRQKVLGLRHVYSQLREELQNDGISLDALDRFLEEKVRPSVEIYSHPDPDFEYFEILAEFDTGIGERTRSPGSP